MVPVFMSTLDLRCKTYLFIIVVHLIFLWQIFDCLVFKQCSYLGFLILLKERNKMVK